MSSTPEYRSPFSLFPLIGIPVFLAISNQTMVSVALPDIGADLGQLRRLPWLVTGYLIAGTVAGPVYGVLGDTWGRARLLMLALGLYIIGSLACAIAGDLTLLAAARLLQGLAGGGLISLSQALIGDAVAPRQRGRAQGMIAMISVIASTLGPVLGGVVVAAMGWRAMFVITALPAFAAMAVLARYKIPHAAAEHRKFDTGGFLALLAFVLCGTLAIEAATEDGGLVWVVLGLLGAAAGFVGLLGTQRRARNPLFPPDLFALKPIRLVSLQVVCHGAALVSLVTLIPLFHAILRTDGALETAMTMLALTVAFGVSGFITGNLITWTGRTVLFPSVTLAISALGIVFLGVYGPGLSRPALMATYLLIGLSNGTGMAVMNTIVLYASPDALRGRAAGAVTFFRSVGAVLGTALTSAVLFALAPHQPGVDASTILGGEATVDPQMLAQWRWAFSGAFFCIAFYVAGGWLMALLNPLRRVE
ncbi:MAG: MFS transporter [Rhodobacter sp.]|nr:MFS transporter [Paracoccaceae bacterium]MCC0077418.1 MFS transporter [Rhodobacter sp.]